LSTVIFKEELLTVSGITQEHSNNLIYRQPLKDLQFNTKIKTKQIH